MKNSYLVAFACWIVLFAGSAHSQETKQELTKSQLQAKLAEKEREIKDLEALRRAEDLRSTRTQVSGRSVFTQQAQQDPFAQSNNMQGYAIQSVGSSPAVITRPFIQQGQHRFGVKFFDHKVAKENNEIDQEIAALVNQIKKSETDEEKQELKNEVKQLLEKKYEIYLGQHETPLKELEVRVEKLRDDLEARRNAKEDLVKLKLDSIWYDAIGLRWPGNSGGNRTIWGTSNLTRPVGLARTRSDEAAAVEDRATLIEETESDR